jgi:hypothetical protein
MKKNLFAIAMLLLSIYSTANDACDMFDAELSIVQDQMKSIAEDVQSCQQLSKTAADEKNKATDDKIMRLIKSAHKQADLMSHSITQISLRKECACEEFDFEMVNQKIIEVKYWIKRAESVDLEKQKSDQYTALTTNVNKLNKILIAFATYINDPCKSAKPPAPEPEEEVMVIADTLVTQTEPAPPVIQDTIITVASDPTKEKASETILDTVISPTVKAVDTTERIVFDSIETPLIPIIDTLEIEEKTPQLMDTVVSPIVTTIDTSRETDTASLVEVVDSTVSETLISDNQYIRPIMDTVRSLEISVSELITPIIDTVRTTEISDAAPEETEAKEETIPKSILMYFGKYSGIEISAEPVTMTVPEPDPKIDTEPLATSPRIQQIITPVALTTPIEKPILTSKTEETVGFYYAVQVAAGADKTMPGSVSKLTEGVYIYEEGGMNKFRVGHFLTLNETVNSKNAIFKKGITDAFIVAYSNGNKIGIGEAKKIEAGSPSPPSSSTATTAEINSIKKKHAPKPITSKIKNKAEVFLAVQVGASLTAADPIYELAKYEHQLQMQIKVLQGKPVRYYTGETNNKNEAEQTLSLVKSKGVDDAFLIGISNGERVDYKAALEHLKL